MLNAIASLAAKEQGQQLALELAGDWKDRVLMELRGWLAIHRAQGNSTMTLEQFRADAKNQPASHKAWGSLPRLACKEGLIAPALHGDGSPVTRPAESVKTHGHLVRVWLNLFAFSCPFVVPDSPTVNDGQEQNEFYRTNGVPDVGERLHGGSSADLLRATAEYHRQREAGA